MVKLFRQKGIRKKEKREKKAKEQFEVQNCFFGNKLAFSRHFELAIRFSLTIMKNFDRCLHPRSQSITIICLM
jgi:hypothetical protein